MTDADASWVVLTASSAVDTAGVVPVDPFDVVVWRTAAGSACVMESRCPHEWTHLGAEGVVDGDELVCCSHLWRFTTSGAGSTLGRDGTRTERASIGVFPCREIDDRIEALIPKDRQAP